jgi:hypothetical protein
MKPLSDLLETQEPAWPQVKEWLTKAKNPVEILETTGRRGADVLVALQVTTRSPMGAIAFETGGLLVDHGWLRLLGSGGLRMEGDLARWNGLTSRPLVQAFSGAMIVAHDVIGGFFALDGGALGEGKGATYYLAPDTLEWEDVGFGYSGLVHWALNGDVAKFYADFRWPGWEAETKALSPDRGFNFYPPLFAEAESLTARSRKDVPMPELLALNLSAADQV